MFLDDGRIVDADRTCYWVDADGWWNESTLGDQWATLGHENVAHVMAVTDFSDGTWVYILAEVGATFSGTDVYDTIESGDNVMFLDDGRIVDADRIYYWLEDGQFSRSTLGDEWATLEQSREEGNFQHSEIDATTMDNGAWVYFRRYL